MLKEEKILNDYLKANGLKQSSQRREILMRFIETEEHLTADELYDIAVRNNPAIGRATVYRSLKVFSDCGLARELKLADGLTRYEHDYRHEHHDHLVCTGCKRVFEVLDPRIEKLQDTLAASHGFIPEHHAMTIYGKCGKCSAE